MGFKSVVPKSVYTLESPGDYLRIPKLRLHPKPVKSQALAQKHQGFLKLRMTPK